MAQEIKHSLPTLVDEFYSRRFIDQNEQEVLQKDSKSSYDRTSQLLRNIYSKIESNSSLFNEVLEVLNDCTLYDRLVTDLKEEVRKARVSKPNHESEILLKHHFLLVGTFEPCISAVAAQLREKDLIDQDTERSLSNASHSNIDKAVALVDRVERMVQENAEAFETLVFFLNERFSSVGSIFMHEKQVWTKTQQQHLRRSWFSRRSRPCQACDWKQKYSELQTSTTEKIEHDRSEKATRIASLEEEKVRHTSKIAQLQDVNKKLQDKIQELEKTERRLQEKLQSWEAEKSSEVTRLKKELTDKETKKEELMKRIKDLEKDDQEKNKKEIKELQSKLASVEEELQEVKLKLSQAEHELELANIRHQHALREQELELKLKWTKEANEKREKEREKEREREREESDLKTQLLKHLFKS